MQDKPDGGCLSPVDEEREPCLKSETTATAAAPTTAAVADKNNGSVTAPLTADNEKPPPTDNNNAGVNSNGKFHPFTAAITIEQKLLDMTGFSRMGLVFACCATILCIILLFTLLGLMLIWPRPPRPYPVCRSASCLRASAEVSYYLNIL